MRLYEKVAIITGASSGIGRAAAILFAKEGAKVVAADVDVTRGNETVKTIRENGGDAVFIETDVSNANQVKEMTQLAVDRFGKLDILFNNAGITKKARPLVEIPEEEFDEYMAINVKSIFLCSKCVIPEMKKNGQGVIINTASTNAVRPRKGLSCYAASKGAAVTLTQALALELAEANIRVNVINPAVVDTPMIGENENARELWKQTIPLGRLGEPDDIAYTALYLASDEAVWVTGASFNIDGGRCI